MPRTTRIPSLLRRAGALVAFAGAAALLPALPAAAEAPVDFGGSDIVDAADVLSPADESRVQDALDELQQDAGVTLLVAYIDAPENPGDIAAWSNQVVADNGLGANNALLVVAVDVREYYFDEGLGLTDAQRTAVERDGLLPALGRDDWAGGAIGAAEQLGAVLTGDEPAGGGGQPGFSFNPLPALLIIGGFVLVVVIALRILSARRKRAALRAQQEDQKQLDLRAGGLLVELDDALKTSEQELGFAEAEFGADQTAVFRSTLASAQEKVREAFRIKQRLDDAEPETPEQRRELSGQIIALCEEADAELDAQAEEFDKLRELGRRAPEALAAMTTEAEAIGARVPAAEAALATLRSRYDASALADIADNPEQVRKLLAFAAGEGTRAAESIRAGQGAAAAVAVRGAQQSLDQARTLLDAVERAGTDLDGAVQQLDGEIDDLRADVADARALPAASASPDLPQLVAEAERAIQDASRGAARRDPVASVIALTALEQRVDAALGPAREQAQRRQRAEAALGRTLQSSRAQLAAADEYIRTRRGGIGADARTRAAEAQRRLAAAEQLAATDPEQALAEAQAAGSLAASALNFARSDVDGFWSSDDASYGPRSTGYRGGSGGDDIAGAILGGIIGGMLGGGGNRGGGFSGGFGGGVRRGGGGWSSGSRSRSGGFGGGRSFGGSGRRGGGGRF